MKYATTILVFCVAALLSLGLVMLYSSSMSQSGAAYPVAQVICWLVTDPQRRTRVGMRL